MSNTPLHISDTVHRIIEQSAAVLFLDTCTLLDIIRLPFRQKCPTKAKAYFLSVQKVIQLIHNKELTLVIPPPVEKEWEDNLENTKAELSRHIEMTATSLQILSVLHASNTEVFVIPDIHSFDTESFLVKICENLLLLGVHVEQDDTLVLKANYRVVEKIPPSRKGAIKDCIIHEHCLQIASNLRNQGFLKDIVFFTSNTQDFCEKNGTVKYPIHDEFTNLNIKFCSNWSWTINDINK